MILNPSLVGRFNSIILINNPSDKNPRTLKNLVKIDDELPQSRRINNDFGLLLAVKLF